MLNLSTFFFNYQIKKKGSHEQLRKLSVTFRRSCDLSHVEKIRIYYSRGRYVRKLPA